jgi:pantetheine-phosphate adenylyltransferase
MRLALFPGTFDPITRGHLDVIARALDVFDRVEVTVAINASKSPLFTLEERVGLVRASLAELLTEEQRARADVVPFRGLIADQARRRGATALVRGLRQGSDFDYEQRIALANRRVAGVETVFFLSAEEHIATAASIVRDLHRWGGDVASFVPEVVERALAARAHPPAGTDG